MTPALIMLVIPGLPSYNGAEVYYLKGVIGLPIVISFRDWWYIHFFFLNGAHWWHHRHRLDRFRFQNFQSPAWCATDCSMQPSKSTLELLLALKKMGIQITIFLISPWKYVCCGYSLEEPSWGHSKVPTTIAADKRGYPHNIFLISWWKHMLWVLIRSASAALLMSTHNICFHWEIRKYQHFSDEKSALSVAMPTTYFSWRSKKYKKNGELLLMSTHNMFSWRKIYIRIHSCSEPYAYMPYFTLWDKISQNLFCLEGCSHKKNQISQNFQTILQ